MDNNKKMLEIYGEILGEIICFLPLLYIVSKLNSLHICIIAMISFFVTKFYLKESLEHLKTQYCILLTYTVFILIVIFDIGVKQISIYSVNQPMIIILLTLTIAYLCAYIGIKQRTAKLYEDIKNKDFTRFGFSPTTAQIAYDWKVNGLDTAELLEKYPKLTADALSKRKTRINQRLKLHNVDMSTICQLTKK